MVQVKVGNIAFMKVLSKVEASGDSVFLKEAWMDKVNVSFVPGVGCG